MGNDRGSVREALGILAGMVVVPLILMELVHIVSWRLNMPIEGGAMLFIIVIGTLLGAAVGLAAARKKEGDDDE